MYADEAPAITPVSAEHILKESAWIMKTQVFMGIDGKLDYLIRNVLRA